MFRGIQLQYTRLDISEYIFAVVYKWFTDIEVFWKVTIFELHSKNTFNANIFLKTLCLELAVHGEYIFRPIQADRVQLEYSQYILKLLL